MPSKNVADVVMSKAPLTPAKPLPDNGVAIVERDGVANRIAGTGDLDGAAVRRGTPFCTKPVGATDCTMADTALDGPLVSVLSTLVSVAVRL